MVNIIKPVIQAATKQTTKKAGGELLQQSVKRVRRRVPKVTPKASPTVVPEIILNTGEEFHKQAADLPYYKSMNSDHQNVYRGIVDHDVSGEVGGTMLREFENAGFGDEVAQEALNTRFSADFAQSPLMDASDARAKIQGIADEHKPLSKEETRFENLKKNSFKTDNIGRQGKGWALQNGQGKLDYRGTGIYPPERTGEGAITNLHHVGFLDKLFRAIGGHNSWINWKFGTDNPIAVGLEARGIKLGNWAENMADVLSVMTDRSRQARKRALFDMSGGMMHEHTINDMIGGYGPTSSGVAFGEMTKGQLEAGMGKVEKTAPDMWKSKKIRIRDPNIPFDRKNPMLGVIEEWQPKTVDEFERRFEIVAKKLEDFNPDWKVKEVPKISGTKIGSKLDIYGGDHDLVHEITDILEETPGNPIYEMKQAFDSGELLDMPVDEVIEMQFQQVVTMETVLGNILQKR